MSTEIISPSVTLTKAPPSEMSKNPIIEAIDLKKRFGQTIVLRGVSLTLCKGEVIVIVGRSGSGKSTLLRCINHIVPPDEGQVQFNGRPFGSFRDDHGALIRQPMPEICGVRARMPMVFQRFNLFQHQSALQNVIEAQITVLRRSKADAEARAVAALERVGLRNKLASHPLHLSGGEQQRVGIARALAMAPDVILFDEPTSALDPELVGEVLQTIRQLAGDGMSMIVVSHEMGFARQIADCIYFIDEGIVLEKGPPEQIFESPENPRTRAFVRGFSK